MDCCIVNEKTAKICKRISDKKIFTLPRKHTRKRCKNWKGFSMKSSCAPYIGCTNKKKKKKKKKNYKSDKSDK